MTRSILCYGDSNTWGSNPADETRYPPDVRWPGALRLSLGEGYHVVEEGLRGRTTTWNDPLALFDRNGRTFLPVCLETHTPLDLVILLLGTNDLKQRWGLSPFDIAHGAQILVELIQASRTGPGGSAPRVLLICPPPLATLTGRFIHDFEGGAEKSRRLAPFYQAVAEEYGCAFLDAGQVVTTSDLDGVHWAAEEHLKLGQAAAEIVRGLF